MPELQILVLTKWDRRRLAVHLGRRRHEDHLLLLYRGAKDDFGRAHVGFNRVHGTLDDQPHTHRCREVHHDVGAIHQFAHQRHIERRADAILEPWPADEVRDVFHRPCREVIEHHDTIAAAEQPLREMGTNEATAAGDADVHATSWRARSSATRASPRR